MKKLLLALALFTTPLIASPGITDSELHFHEYRMLLLESSALEINQILDSLLNEGKIPEKEAEEIRLQVFSILVNMGASEEFLFRNE